MTESMQKSESWGEWWDSNSRPDALKTIAPLHKQEIYKTFNGFYLATWIDLFLTIAPG